VVESRESENGLGVLLESLRTQAEADYETGVKKGEYYKDV